MKVRNWRNYDVSKLVVYVAAPLALWSAAQDEQRWLCDIGCVIAHDWTQGAADFINTGKSTEQNFEIARDCIEAVAVCDVVVCLLSSLVPTAGCWVEIGAALAQNKPVVVMLPEAGLLSTMGGSTEYRDQLVLGRFLAWRASKVFLDHPSVLVTASHVRAVEEIQALQKAKSQRIKENKP